MMKAFPAGDRAMRATLYHALLLTALLGLAPVPGDAAAPFFSGNGVPSLAPLVAQITPAVVSISVRGVVREQNPLFRDPFFRRFFDAPQEYQHAFEATGSGVIVDAQRGLILTNTHVVEHGSDTVVTTKDNRKFHARLIGQDTASDIAILRIPADHLTAIEMGDSDHLRVGDFVLAIGNPFGLGQTVTSGIVSALGRSGIGDDAREHFIQTDAAINPGNSGGALVDLTGRLVGINTAILSPTGGNIGIGFAIPVAVARRALQQIAH
jgi:serine protease Do